MPKIVNIEGLTRKEREKKREKAKKHLREYYMEHREEILERRKKEYAEKKKVPKCKMCGKEIPGTSGHTKYCLKCLYGKGHGPDAHRMAATRWYRKNYLTKKHDKDTIKLYVVDFSKKRRVSYEETRSK